MGKEWTMKYAFGIDLGGTTVKIACFQETGECLDEWEIPTNLEEDGSKILSEIASQVLRCLKEKAIPETMVLGIGIGVPGPVVRGGIVNRCINLGWGVVNVEQELSALTGFPVKALNDANAAALGEYFHGGGKGYSSMLFVTLGTGVGGGIVIDGKILFGAHGSGAEIGHILLYPHEKEVCSCGNFGCAEQYCSATGIVRLAEKILSETEERSLLRNKKEFSCKDIFDAGKQNDPVALQILDRYFGYLGQFLGSVCSVIDPEVVVLGGGVSRAGSMLLDGIRPYFQKHVFHAASACKFCLATLSSRAGVYGAFSFLRDELAADLNR